MKIARHEVQFYPDDASLLVMSRSSSGLLSRPDMGLSLLRPSHTETAFLGDWRHMAWILPPLLSWGNTSRWMLATRSRHLWSTGCPNPARFFKFFGDLIVTAAEAAKGEQARVAVFGEGVQPSVHRVTQRRRFGSKDLRIG